MDLEVQYVSCQELHNPFFTPRIVSSQNDISADHGSPKTDVVKPHGVEFTSALANPSGLTEPPSASGPSAENVHEERRDIVPQPQSSQIEVSGSHKDDPSISSAIFAVADDIERSSSGAVPPVSSLIFVSPTEVPQAQTPSQVQISLPEEAPEQDRVINRSCAHVSHSDAIVEAEHDTTVRGPTKATSTSKLDEPFIPEPGDDDVQFILAITRKKRKKRPRQDPPPIEQDKGVTYSVGKDAPQSINNHTNQGVSASPHIADPKHIVSESLHGSCPRMDGSQGQPSFPSANRGSLPLTTPSAAGPTSDAQTQIAKKRKGDQDNSFAVVPQPFKSADADSGPRSMQTPILPPQLAPPRSCSNHGPNLGVTKILSTQPANKNQLASVIRAGYPLHDHGFPYQGRGTSVAPTHGSLLARPGTSLIQAPLTSASISENLRRRPSLYSVPQWRPPPLGPGVVMQSMSVGTPRSTYQNPCASENVIPASASPAVTLISMNANIPPDGMSLRDHFAHATASQAQNLQQPMGISTETPVPQLKNSKPSHPPNMLVDIAQTCQDNFPFALIAKRHNEPIQKVFDTFSAVIQLPLLRSAVDARRPGKLGSLRMKEFRAMKKAAKEVSAEELGRKKAGKKTERGAA